MSDDINTQPIQQEIGRFEGVHPAIYAAYELIEEIDDPVLQEKIRYHLYNIEDSFVNSQEWTLDSSVSEIRVGVLGSLPSGKSALVHRFLTGAYLQDESPEGGRFKKEVQVTGGSRLLLIRDEGGVPEEQFAMWAEGLIFVFSLDNETSFNAVPVYHAHIKQFCELDAVPCLLVGTQDTISETRPRVIEEERARALTTALRMSGYYETCATYGHNVDRVFQDMCEVVLKTKKSRLPGAANLLGSLVSTPIKCPVVPTPSRSAFAPISSSRVSAAHASSVNSAVRSFRSLFRPEHSLSGTPTGTMSSEEGAYCQANAMTIANPQSSTNCSPPSLRSRGAKESRSWRSKKLSRLPPAPSDPSPAFRTPEASRGRHNGWPAKERLELNYTSESSEQVPLSSSVPANRPSVLPAGRYDPLPCPPEPGHQYHVLARTPGPGDGRSCPPISNLERTNSASCEVLDSKDLASADKSSSIRKSLRRKSHIFKKNDEEKKQAPPESPAIRGRPVPCMEGCLYKKSTAALGRDWKKKYVVIEDSKMVIFQNRNDYLNNGRSGKEINLILTTVKVPGQLRVGRNSACMDRSQKEPSGASSRRRTPSESGEAAAGGTQSDAGQEATPGFVRGREVGRASSRRRRRAKSGSKFADSSTQGGYDSDGYEFHVIHADNKQWLFEADTRDIRDAWVEALDKAIKTGLGQRMAEVKGGNGPARAIGPPASQQDPEAIMRQLRAVAGNASCADCGAVEPKWASLNLGVLICIQCSGVHRRLGSHISRVRSLELDDWPEPQLAVMRAIGNTLANSVWEAAAGPGGRRKPQPNSSDEEKAQWIRAKYEQRSFLPPVPYADAPLQQQLVDAITRADSRQLVLCLAKAGPECLNEPYSRQDSRRAIHIAATLGQLPYLQLLLWYNADVTVTDAEGRNAYFYAIASCQPDCARFLFSHGCPAEALHHNNANPNANNAAPNANGTNHRPQGGSAD